MNFLDTPFPSGESMDSFLAKRVEEGIRKRYSSLLKRPLLDRARKQAQHELELMHESRLCWLLPDRLGHNPFLPAVMVFSFRDADRLQTPSSVMLLKSQQLTPSEWNCFSNDFSVKAVANGLTSILIFLQVIIVKKSFSISMSNMEPLAPP